jgi:mobilization protein
MDAEKIETNTPKAYIHFERATAVAFFHNSREAFLPQTSYEELRGKNICDRTAAEARALYKKLDEQADAAFLAKAGRRTNMKEGNKIWEYVCLLKEENTWEDVERLMRRVEQETGYTTLQASLHEDEGHVDENGIFRKNRHIQVDVFTRSLEDGRSLCLENYGRKDLMKKLQKIVSEELGLEEGEPKEITKRKHIPHRKYRAMKEAEKDKEWEQKLNAKDAEWQAKMAEKQKEWEAKQAEREEWEKKIPEIIAARERRSKFISDKLDWESARDGKKLAYEMEMLGLNFAGVSNPNGNILLEAQKDAIRNVFKMLGVTAQLAVFLMNKTLANDEKIKSDAKIYNVESTLLRAVDYVANSDPANAEELKKRIKRTLMTIPEEKREELFQYAIENAPTPELKADIKALVEGRFEDIAKSEQAQKRIENRDLRQALKEYSEEIKRIKEELREMDEENRILNLAERAILREKGAGRDEYAEQESQNRERLNDLKQLKDEVKALNNTIQEQKQTQEKDAKTVAEQAEKIAKLTKQISELTAENAKKQRELEQELEAEKAARKTAETLDAFGIIDDLEQKLKPREEQKPEPKIAPEPVKPEPEPEPKPAKDDNLNIYGYSTPKPETRRRFDYEPRRPREDDRPKYEPEPEKIEPISEEPIFRDPWQEITDAMEKWKKCESEAEKKMLSIGIYQNIEKYEKSGVPPHRQLAIDSYRSDLNYDPADAIHRERERKLETECKRQQAEMAIKYEEVKTKSVKQQEDDARQTSLKKKRKDELEFGSI